MSISTRILTPSKFNDLYTSGRNSNGRLTHSIVCTSMKLQICRACTVLCTCSIHGEKQQILEPEEEDRMVRLWRSGWSSKEIRITIDPIQIDHIKISSRSRCTLTSTPKGAVRERYDHPRIGQIEEDGVRAVLHAEALVADVAVATGHPALQLVLLELLVGHLHTILMKVERVQVTGRVDGAEDRVREWSGAGAGLDYLERSEKQLDRLTKLRRLVLMFTSKVTSNGLRYFKSGLKV